MMWGGGGGGGGEILAGMKFFPTLSGLQKNFLAGIS